MNRNLNKTNDQFTRSNVEKEVTEDDFLLEVRESETKNRDRHNSLLVKNSELIKMLAGQISCRIKKKSIWTVFKYWNPTTEI